MDHDRIDRRTLAAGFAVGATLISAGAAQAALQASPPTARTRYGQVRGFRRNGAEIFLGLPYGASTAGERRFKPSIAPAAWTGVRDATKLGQRAPSPPDPMYPLYLEKDTGPYMTGGRAAELVALNETMGEDCLVVNVLTPRADNKGRPVMVYLHGGGFAQGSGAIHTLGDKFVAEEDVVLVTVNHRLSTMGFLYLGGISPAYADGNVGMLDIVAALTWVKANIANFGGDPAKVMIFGESGGGGKVSLCLAMPQAKGLFRAAVIQSSGANSPSPADGATRTARTLLDRLGITGNDLSRLASVPLDSFLSGGGGPVADGRTLQAAPWGAGAPATAADVPLIVGYTADEATLFTGRQNPDTFTLADFPAASARLAALTQRSEAALAPAFAAYRAVYPRENPSDIFFRMMSIGALGRGGRLIADAKAAQPAPIYYYRMEYDTKLPPGLRAFHTCELPLVNRMVLQPQAEGLSKQLAGAWAAFARTGNDPSHPGMPKWGRYRPGGQGPIMLFRQQGTSVGPDPEEAAQALLRAVLAAPAPAAAPAGAGRGG